MWPVDVSNQIEQPTSSTCCNGFLWVPECGRKDIWNHLRGSRNFRQGGSTLPKIFDKQKKKEKEKEGWKREELKYLFCVSMVKIYFCHWNSFHRKWLLFIPRFVPSVVEKIWEIVNSSLVLLFCLSANWDAWYPYLPVISYALTTTFGDPQKSIAASTACWLFNLITDIHWSHPRN